MSSWTYINGMITVAPLGETQFEKKYVLETILSHLPLVTGSEKNMATHIIQKAGFNERSNNDEFGQHSNLLNSNEYWECGWMIAQSEYIIVVEGALRDREYLQTLKEFNNWICRLSKRCFVTYTLVNISSHEQSTILTNNKKVYSDMYEYPAYGHEGIEPNWAEYLMWQPMKDSQYPALLAYKYSVGKNKTRS